MCTQICAGSPYIIRVEELNLRTEKYVHPGSDSIADVQGADDCVYTNFDSFLMHYVPVHLVE